MYSIFRNKHMPGTPDEHDYFSDLIGDAHLPEAPNNLQALIEDAKMRWNQRDARNFLQQLELCIGFFSNRKEDVSNRAANHFIVAVAIAAKYYGQNDVGRISNLLQQSLHISVDAKAAGAEYWEQADEDSGAPISNIMALITRSIADLKLLSGKKPTD